MNDYTKEIKPFVENENFMIYSTEDPFTFILCKKNGESLNGSDSFSRDLINYWISFALVELDKIKLMPNKFSINCHYSTDKKQFIMTVVPLEQRNVRKLFDSLPS